MPDSRMITSAQKTATSVVLGNDYLPKKTTYQCTHNVWTDSKKSNNNEKCDEIALAEVLPRNVYPPPTEPLRRTIYQDDFGSIDFMQTGQIYTNQQKTANIIAGIHHLPGVPLAPHDDLCHSATEPSQQQTAYKNKMEISKEWASIQKLAEHENSTSSAQSINKAQVYESLPTEHQRQFRWPMPDDIHVVTYQQMKN
jgi:hypothetical protein